MENHEPDETRFKARFDDSNWHVKWGFDSGDCFTVFPLLPKLPNESECDRCLRSFTSLRDAEDMLCITSEAVEVLLRRILAARFDTTLGLNSQKEVPWRSRGFDWYYDNVYTVDDCRKICTIMRRLSTELNELPGDELIYVTENGEAVAYESSPDDWWRPIAATDARRDCILIADYLDKTADAAEKQSGLVTFSGP